MFHNDHPLSYYLWLILDHGPRASRVLIQTVGWVGTAVYFSLGVKFSTI
jgi:hypothetical protein